MSVLQHLERMGGVATRATLVRVCSRAAVDAALAAGDLTVLARGRSALPQAEEAVLAAHRLSGVVSHLSAAQRWGWEVRLPPDLSDVTVPKGRKLGLDQRRGVRLHRADLFLDDIRDGVTSRERTLLGCLRTQPYLDALAVADSALRHGVPFATLATLARDARGPGGSQVRRVLTPRTAGPPIRSSRRCAVSATTSTGCQCGRRRRSTSLTSSAVLTWSTPIFASCWRQTRSSGTGIGVPCAATAVATTSA